MAATEVQRGARPVIKKNNDTLPVITLITDNDAQLHDLAVEFKAVVQHQQGLERLWIEAELEKAKILKSGHGLTSSEGFERWAKETLGLGSTYAYNLLGLLERPDLVDMAFQTSGKAKISHVFALLAAPIKATELAKAQFLDDSQPNPTVKQLEQMAGEFKKEAAEARKEADQARKEAEEWRESCQTQQDINQRNLDLIDQKANEKVKEKIAEIEEHALSLAAQESQSRIDSLQESLSGLRAKLAGMERTGERQKIEADIAEKQSQLRQLNKRLSTEERNINLNNALTGFLVNLTNMTIGLEQESTLALDYLNIEKIKLVRHQTREFERLIDKIVTQNDDVVDIED